MHLILAGEGPARADVEAAVRSLGLETRVTLTGHYRQPERLIAIADVCVLASLREGLPRVVVQYLAGGKPVVVTRLPGIEEIVEHDGNGLIVNSAGEVAREAVRLARDEARCARLAGGARASDVGQWSFANMFSKLDEAYAELVGARQASGA